MIYILQLLTKSIFTFLQWGQRKTFSVWIANDIWQTPFLHLCTACMQEAGHIWKKLMWQIFNSLLIYWFQSNWTEEELHLKSSCLRLKRQTWMTENLHGHYIHFHNRILRRMQEYSYRYTYLYTDRIQKHQNWDNCASFCCLWSFCWWALPAWGTGTLSHGTLASLFLLNIPRCPAPLVCVLSGYRSEY